MRTIEQEGVISRIIAQNRAPHVPLRVILAGTLLAEALTGCSAFLSGKYEDGDILTAKYTTDVWQYPGGDGAGRILAPQGQKQLGVIKKGVSVEFNPEANDTFKGISGGYGRICGQIFVPLTGEARLLVDLADLEQVEYYPSCGWVDLGAFTENK